LIVQVFPAATVPPLTQAPVVTFWKKSPVIASALMFRVALPELVRVMVFTEALWPTTTFPHTSEVGVSFTFAPLMVMVTVVVCDKLPDVPVIVITFEPAAADAVAVSVNVLFEVVGFGLNAAVTPLGRPEATNVTLPLKPFEGTTAMVLVPLLPGGTVTLLGVAVRL